MYAIRSYYETTAAAGGAKSEKIVRRGEIIPETVKYRLWEVNAVISIPPAAATPQTAKTPITSPAPQAAVFMSATFTVLDVTQLLELRMNYYLDDAAVVS